MYQDPIIEEIHKIRDEYAERFNYDLHAMCEDLRKRQLLSLHKVVTRPSRKPVSLVKPQNAMTDCFIAMSEV